MASKKHVEQADVTVAENVDLSGEDLVFRISTTLVIIVRNSEILRLFSLCLRTIQKVVLVALPP